MTPSLVAAYEAGCHADGLELNPIYIAMSAFRLNQSMVPRGQAQAQDATGPLFGETT